MTRRRPGAGTANGPTTSTGYGAGKTYGGLDDDEYTAAIKHAEDED